MRGASGSLGGVSFHAPARTTLLLFAAVAIIGVTQAPATAQSSTAQLSAEYMKCINAPNQTNYGFTGCGAAELKRQAQYLDQVWADVMKQMRDAGTASAAALQREQDAWVKFKDASCEYYQTGDFGA